MKRKSKKKKQPSIIGVGVDIEDIKRFRRFPVARYESFYQKLFTKQELTYCLRHKDPYPHLAVRFSAKEATCKALGAVIDFIRLEVCRNTHGTPSMHIFGRRSTKSFLSLSHTREQAIAFVIITKQ